MCSFPFGDQRPQQTLYMGCSSNSNTVSLSPLVENERQVTNLPMTFLDLSLPLALSVDESIPA